MDLPIYHCGEVYHTDSSNIGKRIQCRRCGEIFTIEMPGLLSEVRNEGPSAPSAGQNSYPTKSSSTVFPWWKVIWLITFGVAIGAIVTVTYRPSQPSPTTPVNTVSSPAPVEVAASQQAPEASPPPVASSLPQVETASKADLGSEGAVSDREDPALPTEALLPKRSLPNGAEIIEPLDTAGKSKLAVANGTAYDAFIKLTDGNIVRQVKYVTAGDSITLYGISECVCRVMFGTGVDFDGETFTRHASYMEFDDALAFSERETERGVLVRSYRITLNPVIGGNARTHTITKEQFQAAKLPQR